LCASYFEDQAQAKLRATSAVYVPELGSENIYKNLKYIMAVVTTFPTRKTHSGGEKEQENLAKIQEVNMTG